MASWKFAEKRGYRDTVVKHAQFAHPILQVHIQYIILLLNHFALVINQSTGTPYTTGTIHIQYIILLLNHLALVSQRFNMVHYFTDMSSQHSNLEKGMETQ